ncbi:MAG: hypothetical protein M3Q65_08380 [Chloroflexota bacterium]|nr:hypothetical protein [Chloroflexota bacterium]
MATNPPERGPSQEALEREMEESNASILMSDEMLANAMAHGETVDLDRRHEESLAAAAEIEAAENAEDAQTGERE